MAQANSIGTASLGSSIADAQATGIGTIVLAHGTATSFVDNIGKSESRAVLSQTAPTFANAASLNAVAYAVGLPTALDINNAFTSKTNVPSAFDSAGAGTANVHGLGVAVLNDPSIGSGVAHTYSSVIDFTENSTALSASKNLVAGMITSPLTGAGLARAIRCVFGSCGKERRWSIRR